MVPNKQNRLFHPNPHSSSSAEVPSSDERELLTPNSLIQQINGFVDAEAISFLGSGLGALPLALLLLLEAAVLLALLRSSRSPQRMNSFSRRSERVAGSSRRLFGF